jgi:beta-glucosidase
MRLASFASLTCSSLLLVACDLGSAAPIGTGGSESVNASGTGSGSGSGSGGGGGSVDAGAGSGARSDAPGGTSGAGGTPPSGGGSSANREPFPTPACLDFAAGLLAQMTLDEKAAQTIQAERKQVTTAQITQYGVGSIYSEGGSAPSPNTPAGWAAMIGEYRAASRASAHGIPIIYGLDSVHGVGPVAGATVFPHNIGLGAIGDPAFVEQVARVISDESAGVGADFPFAPVIAVGRDERWGRTYEAFAETPSLASDLGVAMVKGLQFPSGGSKISILANAKHYVGDGGTALGVTGGPVTGDEAALRALHLEPYRAAVAARVGSIMLSYSSWQGVPMHSNKRMVTDVLKGELGFGGFVGSDYNGCFQVGAANAEDSLAQCLNAGTDMLMIFGGNTGAPPPFGQGSSAHSIVRTLVEKGTVPMSRLDDAVRRILAVKCEMGLFESDGMIDAPTTARVGSTEHRMLARQAVQKSLVVLKNDDVLPLSKTEKVALTGSSAQDTGNQCGGWTITWQGMTGDAVPGATSIRTAMEAAVGAANVIYSESASDTAGAAVGVAVIGETPYAEGKGDRTELTVPEVATVMALKAAGLKTVVVLVAGRPMILDPILAYADAIVMAWLPGSEGAGVTDILYGDARPSGKLPMSWPRTMEQIPINQGDATYDPLYPFGYGLTY